MPSTLIEPDIDVYGRYARASALADFLEVAAIAGKRITRAALMDLIVENEWVARPKRQFLLPEDAQDDPDTWGTAVFNVIEQRQDVLGEKYPFHVRRNALRWGPSSNSIAESSYAALLALTVVHAWRLPSAHSPESILENLVVSCLENKGVPAVGMGTADRASGFVQALKVGGEYLGLRPMDNPTPRSRKAKDVGVDTLAGIVWRDGRAAGQWLLIGQVTTASSQEWKGKLGQPEAWRWSSFLNEQLSPEVFLAVPHHVEDEHLGDLLASRRGFILDRLRLVMTKDGNSDAEKALISEMRSIAVST